MHSPQLRRFPLLAMAIVALLMAMWAGLVRFGWSLPVPSPTLPIAHGPLMVSGFVGTVIALERAVALQRPWAYAAPLLTGAGALILIAGVPGPVGPAAPVAITLGSLGLFAIFVAIFVASGRRQPVLFTVTMAAGALAWLIGNALWAAGQPLAVVAPWWIGFVVLTIAGERLELSRLLSLSARRRAPFVFAVAALVVGLLFDPGVPLAGMGIIGVTLWLLRHDIAWRTIRRGGLARFSATSILSGYCWLGIGGLIWLVVGRLSVGLTYDAILHTIFVGFVLAMIFAHAPIIFPAVLGIPVPFRPRFYTHLALLHASLALRILGDLLVWQSGRRWGGLLNVVAVLLFLGSTAYAAAVDSRSETRRAARQIK